MVRLHSTFPVSRGSRVGGQGRGEGKGADSRCCGLFSFHINEWFAWVGGIKYGMIAAARGAFAS